MRQIPSEAAALLLLLLLACGLDAQYVGSQSCQGCHPGKFESQSSSGHAHALARAPKGSPGQWAFGAGAKAITYVSRIDGDAYLEHGLTYYSSTKSMAPTPGHRGATDLPYPTFDAGASIVRCFRCHSTGQPKLGDGFTIEPAEDGVHCEACHGPGGAHVKAGGAAGTIRNPKQLNAVELNEYCGTCHRKPPQAGEEIDGHIQVGLKFDWSNSWNTRHQPAYLSQSVCFRKSAGALSCLTCHDPHTPLASSAASYDKQCISCHATVRHQTATGPDSCIACHMPEVQAAPQFHFTNHWIGIYARGNTMTPIARPERSPPPLALQPTAAGKLEPPSDPSSLLPLFEQAVADRENELGAMHPKVARSATILGLFLKEIGNPGAAEIPLRKALEIDRRNDDPDIPGAEERLARILEAIGKQREAIELLKQAAAGADPRVSAQSYTSLAKLDPARASFYYSAAVKAEEAALGKDDPGVAALLSNLALTLREKNDLRTAELLLRRALSIQEKSLGRGHYQTAVTIGNLGSLLQKLGRLEEAERLERESLTIFKRKRPHSIELAAAYTNLGGLLAAKGDHVTGVQFLRDAISVDESASGPEAPTVAADLTNLASLLRDIGNQAEADALLKRALSIYEKRLGISSPQAVAIRKALGW